MICLHSYKETCFGFTIYYLSSRLYHGKAIYLKPKQVVDRARFNLI